jgi:hypothetical protein
LMPHPASANTIAQTMMVAVERRNIESLYTTPTCDCGEV